MLVIDHNNVENVILNNTKLLRKLPRIDKIVHHWKLGKRIPAIAHLAQRACYQLLEALDEEHIGIIENFLNEKVSVKSFDFRSTKSIKVDINDLEETLNETKGLPSNVSIHIDDRYAYLSFWK